MAFFEKLLGANYKPELTHAELEKLLEQEFNNLIKEKDAFKNASDKNSSDASEWKKKYTEKLTEVEKKELDFQELVKKNNELVRDKNIADYTSQYIGLGYDENLARETAIAQIDGDFAKVFANNKIHQDKMKADFEKSKLEDTPNPKNPNPSGKMTKEEFDKLGYQARVDLLAKDPNLYAELSK